MNEKSEVKKRISLVVSCYESESTISDMYSGLLKILSPFNRYEFELVMVDDGSSDNTLNLLKDIVQVEEEHIVKVVDLGKNQGQVSCVLAGLANTSGEAIIICSSDLQDPLELISAFIKEWEKGSDLVFGQRVKRYDGLIRKLGAYIWHNLILKTVNEKLPKGGADYGLITRNIADTLLINTSRHRFLQAEIFELAKNVSFVPYNRGEKRNNRKSTWTFSRLVDLMIDISFIQFNLAKGYFYLCIIFVLVNLIVAWLCIYNNLAIQWLYLSVLASVLFLIIVLGLIMINGIKFMIKNQNSTKAFHIKSVFTNRNQVVN